MKTGVTFKQMAEDEQTRHHVADLSFAGTYGRLQPTRQKAESLSRY
jgi:hypothetical protein